jgi:hypothetical protein
MMARQVLNPSEEIAKLVDGWCERRALRPLRYLLPHWPHNGMTDGLYELKTALENVRAFGRDELLADEAQLLDGIISAVDRALTRRR